MIGEVEASDTGEAGEPATGAGDLWTAAPAPSPALAPERPRRARRGVQPMAVVRVVVTIAALALIARKIGVHAILHALRHAHPGLLAAGYAVAGVTILITVSQWHGLANANGVRCSYRRCLHLELGGDVFDAALPSSIGGDVVRASSLAERRGDRVPAAASVVLRRLCNFPGMIVLSAVGLVATAGVSEAGRVRPYAAAVTAGGLVLVLCLLSPALGRLSQVRLLRRGPGRAVAKLLAALHEFRGQRRYLGEATVRGLVFWLSVVASQYLFIRAVGIHVPLALGALVITTTTAVTMVPISLGGYGLREGAFAAFLTAGGHATAAQGAAVGVCITVQMLALGLIGIPFYLTVRSSVQRAVAEGVTPEPSAKAA